MYTFYDLGQKFRHVAHEMANPINQHNLMVGIKKAKFVTIISCFPFDLNKPVSELLANNNFYYKHILAEL